MHVTIEWVGESATFDRAIGEARYCIALARCLMGYPDADIELADAILSAALEEEDAPRVPSLTVRVETI